MFEKPVVDITKANGDLIEIIRMCEEALTITGKKNGHETEYENAILSMREKISESKAYIRTLAILAEYCKIL